MTVNFRCGCGLVNYNRYDWFCHFKERGFWHGLKRLLGTRIEVER